MEIERGREREKRKREKGEARVKCKLHTVYGESERRYLSCVPERPDSPTD